MTEPASPPPSFDDPTDLAGRVAALRLPLVIGLDVDGVLAPIVAHADDARLGDDVDASLRGLDAIDRVHVAVVSGRSLAGLDQFGFPPALTVIGGHGAELRGQPAPRLTEDERGRYNLLDHLSRRAAAAAGAGAWVERKPSSVVLHVREADADRGEEAMATLRADVAALDGVKATPGSKVLELFARPASKGTAIAVLRQLHDPASIVYVGDDVTDEEAFAALGPDDLAIKVGAGPSLAGCRLGDPDAVAAWLAATVAALAS